jgi:hypothetical protein
VTSWAALHHYSALAGSLDPARLPHDDGAAAVPEYHYVGSDDRLVPPWIVRNYARRRATATVIEWPHFDHVCCWTSVWTEIVSVLDPE